MEHIHNCGNCAHFEACDSILKRYAGLSGIAKDGPACGNYAVRIEDILGDDYDLDRLRELIQADRDGRCFISPFIAMVEQSLTNGKMTPQRDQRFNGRYAVVYFDREKYAAPLIDICGKPYDRIEAENRVKELRQKEALSALKREEAG